MEVYTDSIYISVFNPFKMEFTLWMDKYHLCGSLEVVRKP